MSFQREKGEREGGRRDKKISRQHEQNQSHPFQDAEKVKTVPDGRKQKRKKTGKENNSKEDSFNSAWCVAQVSAMK